MSVIKAEFSISIDDMRGDRLRVSYIDISLLHRPRRGEILFYCYRCNPERKRDTFDHEHPINRLLVVSRNERRPIGVKLSPNGDRMNSPCRPIR